MRILDKDLLEKIKTNDLTLVTLNLKNSGINDTLMDDLCRTLSSNTVISKIDLSTDSLHGPPIVIKRTLRSPLLLPNLFSIQASFNMVYDFVKIRGFNKKKFISLSGKNADMVKVGLLCVKAVNRYLAAKKSEKSLSYHLLFSSEKDLINDALEKHFYNYVLSDKSLNQLLVSIAELPENPEPAEKKDEKAKKAIVMFRTNEITDVGAKILISVLPRTNVIEILLDGNNIGTENISLIQEILGKNKARIETKAREYEILLNKAKDGNPKSQKELAERFWEGKEVKQDRAQSIIWYEKAAQGGDVDAQYFLGNCYLRGEGVTLNQKTAVEWLLKAANSGHSQAQIAIGLSYEKGEGVIKNPKQALEWYEKAALQTADGKYHLAQYYGRVFNNKQEYEWYQKAASEGHYQAKRWIEDYISHQQRLRKKEQEESLEKKRLEELRKRAEEGIANYQYVLGDHYETVDRDIEQAMEWYQKAALQGHQVAQQKLGEIFEKGLTGKKDYAQAYFWYQKAADQGNDDACAGLKSLKEKGYTPASSVEFKSALSPSSAKDTKTGAKEDKSLDGSCEIAYEQLTFGKELGRGGFGVVYQGTWRFNNVAIKQLLTKSLSAEALEEFNSESRIMAQLRSDYIVQFRGICVSPTYCLVMEYMPKGSLFNLLRSSDPIDWSVRYRMITEIASGLAFLHASNIFHRDLKSLNVLLDEHYRTKLCDFGLSKVKKENQSTATVGGPVGTIPWMAPELFARRPAFTAKSDIYSLAMTLWEIASRKTPFADADNPGLISAWVTQGQREEIPSDTPLKISSLIRFCWHADPDKRPTAAEVVTYLRSDQTEFKGSGAASSSGALSSQAASIQANLDSVSGSDPTGSTIFQGNLISRPTS